MATRSGGSIVTEFVVLVLPALPALPMICGFAAEFPVEPKSRCEGVFATAVVPMMWGLAAVPCDASCT